MGADDANEGNADDECVEHVFHVRSLLISELASIELRCERCGALSFEQPGIHAVEAAQRAKRRRRGL